MTLFQLWTEGRQKLSLSGNPDAELDARLLLLEAFRLDEVHFLMNRMQPLEDNETVTESVGRYRQMLNKRSRRVPLQQITGSQEFMGMNFSVNRHVLIPRQDTETLVELILEEQKDTEADVLDVCTGSGCIAVSLAAMGGYRSVTATDISADALQVARRNAGRLLAENQAKVCFLQGDLFQALEQSGTPYIPECFDIIVSNPPYIPTEIIRGLQPEVRDYEPMLALDGSGDGLAFYRRIAKDAKKYLKPGGALYLEIGYDQSEAVSGLLAAEGYAEIETVRDLAGKDRIVKAKGPAMPGGKHDEEENDV